MKTKIVVLKDGWVLVGMVKEVTERTIVLDKKYQRNPMALAVG